ncbi:DMT family transporter [Ferrimonas balearica]|uniref:DMT family transporter n=1 Tax=Ferrimonas balearica TaxID=44012 RepID=UPI0028F7387D|nr:DMT family transporter [Ferrimonas balearica]
MDRKAFLYPLAAVLFWAGNNLVGKMSVEVIAPAAIAFYRWALAALVLTPFLLPSIWRARRVIGQNLGRLTLLAALGIVAFQSLAYVAAATTTATNMGLIGALVPLITLLLSLLILKDTPTVGALLGGGLSFVGLAILLGQGQPMQILHAGINIGDAMLLAGATAYALYGVLIKKWVLPLTIWQSLYVQILIGLIWLLPAVLLSPSMAISGQALPLVLYAGIAASLLAPYCWMQGIAKLGASRNANFMNLVPLLTTATAIPLLGEAVHGYHLLGGGLTLGGVMLAQKLKKPIWTRTPEPA